MIKLSRNTRNRLVFAALFAAIIAVSGFYIFPIPLVPIVLKNLFVVLSGAVLGGFYGGICLLIFITAGLLGAPFFVVPGPGVFLTPLGGYIIGYFLASLTVGLICGIPKVTEKKINFFFALRLSLACLSGFAIILFCGVLYLTRLNGMSFGAAIIAGALPYITGDVIKFALCVPLALKLRPAAARYINS
ncbi:MAG: biotin transporter BioY [Treponema sp.]|nr:biotin transporter BioY [Treponema sp.]